MFKLILRLAEENGDYFKRVDAIILQEGANNVLDAELPENISDYLQDIVEVIKNANPDALISKVSNKILNLSIITGIFS